MTGIARFAFFVVAITIVTICGFKNGSAFVNPLLIPLLVPAGAYFIWRGVTLSRERGSFVLGCFVFLVGSAATWFGVTLT